MKRKFFQLKKTTVKYIAVVGIFITYTIPAFAYNCTVLNQDLTSGEDPSPVALVCIIGRVLRVAVYGAGAAFIIYLCYSGYKLAMALGDPKGYQGAQKSATYAFYGLAVVLGVFVIGGVLAQVLGLGSFFSPDELIQSIEDAMHSFLQMAGIE